MKRSIHITEKKKTVCMTEQLHMPNWTNISNSTTRIIIVNFPERKQNCITVLINFQKYIYIMCINSTYKNCIIVLIFKTCVYVAQYWTNVYKLNWRGIVITLFFEYKSLLRHICNTQLPPLQLLSFNNIHAKFLFYIFTKIPQKHWNILKKYGDNCS